MSTSHITLPFSLQMEHPFPLLGSVLVPGREFFSPREGIYFPPLVTNDMSVINNNSSLLMNKVPLLKNNMPLLKNKVPLLQDLTCRFRKVPVERPFKSFYRLQEVTSDLT